jgi:WD40 repeat protein
MFRQRLALLGLLFAGIIVHAQQPSPDIPAIKADAARFDQAASNDLDGAGFSVCYSDETGLLVAGCERRTLHYWTKDIAMGVRAADTSAHVVKAHAGPVLALAAAGKHVVSAGTDGKVIVWDLPAENALHTCDAGTVVRSLAASPDGKLVASAGDSGAVQLWDLTTGKPGAKLDGAHDWLLAVAYSPDGKLVAAGGHEGKVFVWDTATGKKQLEFAAVAPPMPNTAPATNVISALCFSPDSKLLAVGGHDAAIHLFQAADGKYVRSLAGHGSSVTSLAFHPTGTVLASASKDRTVRLWNPANGQLVKALEGHNAWVQGVVFVGQGTRLASVAADQSVRLWDLTDPIKK